MLKFLVLLPLIVALVESAPSPYYTSSVMRKLNLHGYGSGTVNADPMDMDFMGMPVTLGGKGQGDIKGAMGIDLPVSQNLDFFSNDFANADYAQPGHFFANHPQWLQKNSRHKHGADLYKVKPLRELPNRFTENVILAQPPKAKIAYHSKTPTTYLLPLHTNLIQTD